MSIGPERASRSKVHKVVDKTSSWSSLCMGCCPFCGDKAVTEMFDRSNGMHVWFCDTCKPGGGDIFMLTDDQYELVHSVPAYVPSKRMGLFEKLCRALGAKTRDEDGNIAFGDRAVK